MVKLNYVSMMHLITVTWLLVASISIGLSLDMNSDALIALNNV